MATTLLAISAACLVTEQVVARKPVYRKVGGLHFLRIGRLRLTLCRVKEG